MHGFRVGNVQTGQYLRTLNAENGHTKGLYGVGWDSDCQHVYTASADCTIKVGVSSLSLS